MEAERNNALALTSIRVDGGTQTRAAIDWMVVGEYADAMRGGASFPPVTVFYDGSDYWLADGFHRYHAASKTALPTIPADVRQGTRRDAVLHSVGVNDTHGLRRTNADKRRAVETLLRDAEWVLWSDREIARRCAVVHTFVGDIRRILSGVEHQIERNASRNGTTYPIDTTNIGRTPRTQTYEQERQWEMAAETLDEREVDAPADNGPNPFLGMKFSNVVTLMADFHNKTRARLGADYPSDETLRAWWNTVEPREWEAFQQHTIWMLELCSGLRTFVGAGHKSIQSAPMPPMVRELARSKSKTKRQA